jgi:superoxide dismutase, Fe-Mn family
MKYLLPELPFSYDAFEPHLDAKTVEIHHRGHHKSYVDKLNEALADHPQWQRPVEELLTRLEEISEPLRTAVRQNGGGHENHTLFWSILTPNADTKPRGDLWCAISFQYDSYARFQERFTLMAETHFSNGWAWLCAGPDKKLVLTTTADHDSPLTLGLQPLLALDLWEHAYYLKHQNRRREYIDHFWSVVNWEEVARRWDEISERGQTSREWLIAA